MATGANYLQPRAPLGFEYRFLIVHNTLALVTVNEFRCRRECGFENSRQHVIRKMVQQLADCVERFGAMWTARSNYGVERRFVAELADEQGPNCHGSM